MPDDYTQLGYPGEPGEYVPPEGDGLLEYWEQHSQYIYGVPLSTSLAVQAAIGGTVAALMFARTGRHVGIISKVEDLVKGLVGRAPAFKKLIPPVYEGTEEALRALPAGERGWTRAAIFKRRLPATRDFAALHDVLRGRMYRGDKTGITASVLAEVERRGVKEYEKLGLRQLTVHDVVYNKTIREEAESLLGMEARHLQARYRLLAETGEMRSVLRLGETPETPESFAKLIAASPTLFVKKGGKIQDIGRFTPHNLLTWASRLTIPGLNWRPLELMIPTELMHRQPLVGAIGGEYAPALLGKYGVAAERALFAGGRIFPAVQQQGERHFTIGTALPGRFRAGHPRSGMYRGAAARLGIPPGYGTAEDYLRGKGIISEEVAAAVKAASATGQPYTAKQIINEIERYGGKVGALDKLKVYAATAGERVGVGPQYSDVPARPVSMIKRLLDITKHKPVVTREFKEGVAEAYPTFTTEQAAKLRRLVGAEAPIARPQSVSDLTFTEKLQLKLGLEPQRTVTRTLESRARPLIDKMKVARFAPEGVSGIAEAPIRELGGMYAWEAGATKGTVRGVADWLHYHTMRPLWLLGEMTGLGMKPGRTAGATLGKVITRLAVPAVAAASALKYAEYRLERRGIPGPIHAATWAYTRGRLGAQWTLDTLGVTDVAAGIEERLPGIFTSPLSRAARATAAVLGGAALGVPGLIGGAAVGALSLTDITMPYEKLRRIYAGEEKVPIRRGRGWMLGRTPIEGGAPEYYRKHWYPMSRSKYKDVALYGSEQAAWAHGSWLPTPENLFGLKRLFDPHFLERKHYWRRPYPVTGGLLADMPFIGPLSESTVGTAIAAGMGVTPALTAPMLLSRFIKPSVRMHPEAWTGGTVLDAVEPTTTEEAGWRLSGEYFPHFQRTSAMRTQLTQMAGEEMYRLFQWSGLPGFMAGFAKGMVTGDPDWFAQRPQVASASTMASVQRDYYDRSLGGLGGMCFVAGTMISTDSGRVPIEDVQIGDCVVTKDGTLREVTGKLAKESGDLVKIKASTIDSVLTCTSTHRIPVYRKYPCHDRNSRACVPGRNKHCAVCTKPQKAVLTEDVHAIDIKPGDFMCVPITKPREHYPVIDIARPGDVCTDTYVYVRGSIEYATAYEMLEADPTLSRSGLRAAGIPDPTAKEALRTFRHSLKGVSRFRRHVRISPDIAYVLGWWAAEGNLDKNGTVCFTLGHTEEWAAKYLRHIVERTFGSSVTYRNADRSSIRVKTCCWPLYRICEKYIGSLSGNKKLHYDLKSLPLPALTQLFRGIVLGDGWCRPDGGIAGYTSKSAELCSDVFDVAQSLGIRGALNIDYVEKPNGCYPQGTRRKTTTRSYVQWARFAAMRVRALLYGLQQPAQQTKIAKQFERDGVLFVEVLSVEKLDSDTVPVYDLEVRDEGTLHYYTANHLVVHNTEFARRFIPRGRRLQQVNPLPNVMPNWLPGYRSAFEGDRDGFVDFQRGDALSKVAMGEARLPNAGYEELNRLHSGIPNCYSPMDRFLILSDVAPQSEAYSHYKDIVQTWDKAGLLDRHWKDKYQEALYQVDTRFKPPFEEPRFSPTALQEKKVVIDEVMAPTRFRAGGQMYQLAGVEADVERQVWLARSQGKDADFMGRRYAQLKTKLAALEGTVVTIQAGAQGMESAAPAIVPGINSTALSLGLGKEIASAADAQAKFSGNIVERLWDKARHIQMPGPLNWPITKFFGRRSAVEEYKMKEIEGGDFSGWNHPYRNFIRFWGRQTENVFRSTPRIPGEVRRRRELEEYFDNLKFLKNRRLEGRALAGSDPELASHYNKQWRKTMAGLSMDGANFFHDVWGAIPKTERRYFQSFAKESDPKIRKRILNMSPEYMKPIYLGIWGSGKPDSHKTTSMLGAQLFDAPNTQTAMRNTAGFFKQFHLPDPDWAGWSPAVDLEQVRVKTVADTAQDFHDYQIWEGQVRDAEARGVPPAPFLAPVRDDASERFTWARMSATQQLAKMRNELKAHGRNRRRHSWA